MPTINNDKIYEMIVDALGGDPLNAERRQQAVAVLDLFQRISTTWPLRDPYGWVEELAGLDMPRASTAYVKCRRSHSGAPSIAAFLDEYRALDTANSLTHVPCDDCGDSGMITCEDDRRHKDGCSQRGTDYGAEGDCWCHAVVPCHCRAGVEGAATLRRIDRLR